VLRGGVQVHGKLKELKFRIIAAQEACHAFHSVNFPSRALG
jgi:hypothetical protein